jgi:FHS family L-fucose permease-like MFS transporter
MYMLAFFFESLMFPAVFALSIEGLGKKDTQTASAILIMCIVGGAVVPIVMAWVENVTSMAFSFIVPSVCFLFVLIFALYKVIFLKKANI